MHTLRPQTRSLSKERPPSTFVLCCRAYVEFLRFDLLMLFCNFETIYHRVRNCPTRKIPGDVATVEGICAALDLASIWYWKEILCLQRSAATTCLLRQFGIAASLLIGAQQLPFRSHAWTEVDGRVVSDKPYMREMYQILDRF
jgi:hypothetical protein